MRTRKDLSTLLAATIAMASLSGCATYHTTYTNVHPPGRDPVADAGEHMEEAGFFHGWEHFWIFGLLPFENRVDAADECAYERVEQVRTYQSGLQFLLANVQGAFIFVNVWSPYSAKVDCARGETRLSQRPSAS